MLLLIRYNSQIRHFMSILSRQNVVTLSRHVVTSMLLTTDVVTTTFCLVFKNLKLENIVHVFVKNFTVQKTKTCSISGWIEICEARIVTSLARISMEKRDLMC